MKDWQFATADVTANSRMKVTVMKMFSNTLVTWKSYIVHIIQSYGQFYVICQCRRPWSQQSNVLCYMAFIHIVIQPIFGHSTALTWMESESKRPVKCKKYDNTWSPYDLDSVSHHRLFFLSQFQVWSLWQKTIHHTYCCPSFFPSGSFPQTILNLVPMQLVMCLEK